MLIFEANKETPSWFSMMRLYLAHWPDEVPRTFRMLDLIAHGADGHGPVHLLRVSAAEFGFAWEGEERGWIRAALLSLRMLAGLIQQFQSAIFKAWQLKVSVQLSDRKGLQSAQFLDIKGSLQQPTSSHLRERDKMLLRATLCGVFGVVCFLLGKTKKKG